MLIFRGVPAVFWVQLDAGQAIFDRFICIECPWLERTAARSVNALATKGKTTYRYMKFLGTANFN